MIDITFLRHAETSANAAGIWQGHGDAALSERGQAQAAVLGRRLADRSFDVVITSDLPRTMETARLAGLEATPDARWREIDIGRWEGLSRDEVRQQYPDEHARMNAGEPVPLGGGESWQDLAIRIGRTLRELVDEVPDGSRVAVMAHGGVVRAAVEAGFVMGGHRLSEGGVRSLWTLRNTSITEIAVAPDRFQLQVFNDASHLPTQDGGVVALIRHGESEANVSGRWHGRTDGPLSDRGRAQAVALGNRYAPPDRVYASPLQRARATAEALAAPGGVPVTVLDDLVEVDFGAWEDKTFEEIAVQHPDEWSAVFERGEDVPRGGTGETFSAAGERLDSAIVDLVRRHPGERVALVSHGGLIWAAVARLLGIDWRGFRSLAMPRNASVTHVRASDGSLVLADYNTAG